MMKKTWFAAAIVLFCAVFNAQAEALKTGPWRFELKMKHATVPFIVEFEFKKKRLEGRLYNGKETIPLTGIIYSGKKISIPVQNYEITMELTQQAPDLLTGLWVRHNKQPKAELPIKAVHGEKARFPGEKRKPETDLNGKWAVTMTDEEETETPGVVVFEQDGNYLTGSVLTPTGDYRYFEGHVSGSEFETASFDGMFNYVFKGSIKDGKLTASLLSNSVTEISGKKDPKAALPDAYAQTKLPSLEFSFPDLKGKLVSLKDKKFKGKPVIVQFFGSWCPNCIDEMNYLIPWYKENKDRGIEIVALSFERSVTEAEAKRQIIKVQKKKNVPYTLLLAGSTSADKPMDKIKGLQNFISFPTTVFLNKKHEVVKVHAGFTGPSTGEFYEKWKSDFEQITTELLKQ